MIKSSILTAVVLLLGYHLLFPHLSHHFYQISGQQRGNFLRAEHYVYDVPDRTNVILGSSRSLAMNEDMLGPGYVKLTFPGGSVFTALELIRRTGKRPDVILIESNNMEWGVDEEFLHEIFAPEFLALRRYSSIFREEGRPSNFLVGFTEAAVRRVCDGPRKRHESSSSEASSKPSPERQTGEPSLRSQLLAVEVENVQRVPAAALLEKHADELAHYIEDFREKGSTCVLYEMPCDPAIANSPQARAQRRAVETRLPKGKYHWLSFRQDHNYDTVDGVHLTPPEADQLTQRVVEQVNAIVHQEGAIFHKTAVVKSKAGATGQ